MSETKTGPTPQPVSSDERAKRSTIKVVKISGRRKQSVEIAATTGGHFSRSEEQLLKSAANLGETMESIDQVTHADEAARKKLGV